MIRSRGEDAAAGVRTAPRAVAALGASRLAASRGPAMVDAAPARSCASPKAGLTTSGSWSSGSIRTEPPA